MKTTNLPKSYKKKSQKEKKNRYLNAQINNHLLFWFGTGTSIKRGGGVN